MHSFLQLSYHFYHPILQQRTRSWPLGSRGFTFAAPAIWDNQTARYYAALASSSGEQQLIAWEKGQDVSQPTGSKASLAELTAKTVLTGAVHSIWPVSRRKKSTGSASGVIVVFQDGSLASFGGDLAQTCQLRAGEKVTVEAVAASNGDGRALLAVSALERALGAGLKRTVKIVELVSSTPDGLEQPIEALEVRQRLELGQGSPSSAVASVSLGNSLDLSVLWSDGRWQSYNAQHVGAAEAFSYKPGHDRTLAIFQQQAAKVKKTPKKKRANAGEENGLLEGGSTRRLVAIFGTPYVAAVGPEVKPDGGLGGLVVVVLDTQFGCLHKRISLAAGEEGEAKSDSLSALLDSAKAGPRAVIGLQNGGEEGSLLVSTTEEVLVCDVSLPPLSLAGLLGALARTPAVTSESLPAGAEDDWSSGWRGTADQAAAKVSGVYKQAEMEALRTPASAAVLTPSISGQEGLAENMSLISREENGAWDMELLSRAGTAEADVLRRIQEVQSEEELSALLFEHLGGQRAGSDAEPAGPNGLADGPINGHANGRDDSDDSDMEDVLPNGTVHQNGFRKKRAEKVGRGKPRQLSRLLKKGSSQVLAAVAERSVQSKFWSVLESVLWSGNLPTTSVGPFLVRALADAQQLRHLELAIAHLRDLSPSDLSFLLQFLIGGAEAESLRQLAADRKKSALLKLTRLASAVKEGRVSKARRRDVAAARLVADAVDLFEPREAALHPLVAAPQDETVLAAALRELDAAEVSSWCAL
jgi:hypothetical protein